MTVFKTFIKIVKKNKGVIILYTVLLALFGAMNMSANENSITFEEEKPRVLIVNNDNSKISDNLIKYMEDNTELANIKDDENARLDALFYEDVSYIIEIPSNYGNDYINDKNPILKIQSGDSYYASYAEMLLTKYLKIANTYNLTIKDENELISKINDTLKSEVVVNMTSKIDKTSIEKSTFYFNFLSYSVLASLVYIICLILASFKEEKIRKRTIISSTKDKKFNKDLLLSNCLFSLILWIVYILIGYILVNDGLTSNGGFIYLINSFIFVITSTTIAFLLGNIITNKTAISGIVNVIALGSSFLCGAFVPMEYLPDSVIKIAHILPTYYYIKTNDSVKTLETINFDSLKPLFINMGILLLFSIVFIILTNIVSKKKRKIG